jgi:para-nitrobenzyl esterase
MSPVAAIMIEHGEDRATNFSGGPVMKHFNRRNFLCSSAAVTASLALTRRTGWAQSAPLATTTHGRISGTLIDGVNVFKAIAYGADTAKTRFKAPVPPAPWSDVLECTRFTTMAPQLSGPRAFSASAPRVARDVGTESEDCLHLNVWTAGLRDHRKRPVLVYFHGGAYNNGTVNSDLYDGTRLVHRGDVVVVTVNHRLNAFGYFYLGNLSPEYTESGNVGQLDLMLALKWVKNNIEEFGGDPGRVLIFGQSGGGAKCAALMATPAAEGLFHRVMTMSGQQIKGASTEIASERAKTVLEKMGITAGKGLAAQLNALSMEQIQTGARAVSADWLPVVDHVILARNPFDPDAPKLSERVPMILGNVHDETALPMRADDITWDNAAQALSTAVSQYLGPYSAEQVVAKYREIYPNDTPDQVDTAAATAFRAWPGQRWEAERRAANPQSQPHTWVYQMNFGGANGKAMHTIDIPFMFDNIAMAEVQIGSSPGQLAAANALAAMMSEMLIHYGRTGNPNHPGLPEWPSYDLKTRSTMIWERAPHIENDPRREERIFADKSHYHQAGTPLP